MYARHHRVTGKKCNRIGSLLRFFRLSALTFADRAFVAFEIFARAAADIVRFVLTPRSPGAFAWRELG